MRAYHLATKDNRRTRLSKIVVHRKKQKTKQFIPPEGSICITYFQCYCMPKRLFGQMLHFRRSVREAEKKFFITGRTTKRGGGKGQNPKNK